jgi:hypothetical protein
MDSGGRVGRGEALEVEPVKSRVTYAWIGWLLTCAGIFLSLCCINNVWWDLWIYARYTEGTGVITSAKLEGRYPYRLDVRHRVDGRKESNYTEQTTPTYYDRAEAQERLDKCYGVGSVRPCFYDPNDPERDSILVCEGIHPWRSLGILGATLGIAAIGIVFVRWSNGSAQLTKGVTRSVKSVKKNKRKK